MSQPAHIVGKNESALSYPPGWFTSRSSFGLNEAALLNGCMVAVTGHQKILGKFLKAGIAFGRIVSTNPLYENVAVPRGVRMINFQPDPNAVAVKEIEKEAMKPHVEAALRGEWSHKFPNYWSILHHCLFYLLLTGHKEIHIHGCNLTPKGVPGSVPLKHGEYCRRHTGKLIEVIREAGVDVFWHQSYKNYKEWKK